MTGSVRAWGAAALIFGMVGIYATNVALHGDARYGFAFVLVVSASIALTTLGPPRDQRSRVPRPDPGHRVG
jgi:hypothetical protein